MGDVYIAPEQRSHRCDPPDRPLGSIWQCGCGRYLYCFEVDGPVFPSRWTFVRWWNFRARRRIREAQRHEATLDNIGAPEDIVQALSEVYKPEGVLIWLRARNRNLQNYTPLELIGNGSVDRVRAEVERLVGGAW